MSEIFLKRIYDPYDESDGYRILVDRLWPRGIKKENAKLTYWFKEVAPSHELRKSFCHIPERFEEFKSNYFEELRNDEEKSQKLDKLCQLAKQGNITLLYAAKDLSHNHAIVLREALLLRMN